MDVKPLTVPLRSFTARTTLYVSMFINLLRFLEETPSEQLPEPNPTQGCDDCLHFMNFNFEGDAEMSTVNGHNFILPPIPPLIQFEDFKKQAKVYDLTFKIVCALI